MAIPYTFSRSSSGTLLISKTSDAGPNTQFILISTGGMGRSSIINRETSRMPAEHWESMEWYDGRDGEYYRIVFSVVQACANGTQEESNIAVTALETRHLMWGSEVNTPNPAPLPAAHIHEVRLANDTKFWRQPNVHGVGEGCFQNADGTWSNEHGICVYVTESTD